MAVTTTWRGMISSDWQDGQNWSNGVPVNGSGMVAVVDLGTAGSSFLPPFYPTLDGTMLAGTTLDLQGNLVSLNNATLGGAGSFVLNAGTCSIDAKAGNTLDLGTSVTLGSTGTIEISDPLRITAPLRSGFAFVNDGTINNSITAASSVDSAFVNNGLVSGAVNFSGSVSGDGIFNGGAGGLLPLFQSDVASTDTIDFQGSADRILQLAAGEVGNMHAQLIDMAVGDTIEVQGGGVDVQSYAGSALVLDTPQGTATLNVSGSMGAFAVHYDQGNLEIVAAACYVAGTHLLTESGERPIEHVQPGDRLVTVSGDAPELRRVRWVGRSRVDLSRHAQPHKVAPIRIRAGALAHGVPRRDLLVSPDHAMLLGEVLVPAYRLCNGASIKREPARGTVSYWHVEFDAHTLVLAEGAASESYLDTGNRAAFDNGGAGRMLHPDFAPKSWDDSCRKLLLDGDALVAAHARLLARAERQGHGRTDDPGVHLLVDGRVVPPAATGSRAWRFRVPAGARHVRLCSRHYVPSEQDAGQDDHRRLGLPVVAVRADGAALALSGDGWLAPEPGWCWTDGAAALALPPQTCTIETLASPGWATYWIDQQVRGRATQAA